jgi:hypothetical protein
VTDLLATLAVALLNHDASCRDFACLLRGGCPERKTLMKEYDDAVNAYAETKPR